MFSAGADQEPRWARQATEEGVEYVPDVPIRSSRTLDLNVFRARLSCNTTDSPAYSYFARFLPDDCAVDYEFICVDLDQDEVDTELLGRMADRTIRGKRFRSGYFRGAYFGTPAYLLTRNRKWYVFGRELEKVVWPYLVKQALNIFAVENGYLHLKAGAFAHPDGSATLLVGMAGSGKSTFLVRACQAGARFVSNTHSLVRNGVVHGVPSCLRVRNDECFGPLIRQRRLQGHLVRGEYLASPDMLFAGDTPRSAPVRTIVLVNYQADRPERFHRVSSEQAASYLEQFALGLTVYDLRNDLLEYLDRDLDRYTAAYRKMTEAVALLCRKTRCYVANVHMQDASVYRSVLAELGA